jgi:hypothetical protein
VRLFPRLGDLIIGGVFVQPVTVAQCAHKKISGRLHTKPAITPALIQSLKQQARQLRQVMVGRTTISQPRGGAAQVLGSISECLHILQHRTLLV